LECVKKLLEMRKRDILRGIYSEIKEKQP
jgi:hypothetical protein